MTEDARAGVSRLQKPSLRERLYPVSLTLAVVLVDQVTKALVVARVDPYTIGAELFGGFVRVIHARNPAIAFSLGHGLPEPLRSILFTVLPLLVVAAVAAYYWRSSDLTAGQRWLLAGVLGGGVGNIVDRVIRTEGVVDFIDVEFFGILGFDRWPTFNVADASVVVCGLAFVLAVFRQERQRQR